MTAEASWPLLPDAETAPATTGEPTTLAAEDALTGPLGFLGRGLLRPFRRDEKNDFANDGGMKLISAEIGQILGTRCDSTSGAGELPWRTDFGSRLYQLRHRNSSEALNAFALLTVREALARWLPSVAAVRVDVVKSQNPRQMILRLIYVLVDGRGRPVSREEMTEVPLKSIEEV